MAVDVVVASARPKPQGDPSRPPPHAHHQPPQRPPPAVPRHRARSARRARGVGLVLLVDDSLDVREMYSQYLSYRSFSVIAAPDGSQGIELALAARPDVIVMDLAMPNMTGDYRDRAAKKPPSHPQHPRGHPHRPPLQRHRTRRS